MDDGDHEGLHTALHSDPRFIVATTFATLLIAGSAFIWRSNPRNIVTNSHHLLGEHLHGGPDPTMKANHDPSGGDKSKASGSGSRGATAAAIALRDAHGDDNETKDGKVSRSKERRRRGKDPLKDILKNTKKSKVLVKPSRAGDSEDSGTGLSGGPLPKISEVTRHTREPSQATSNRSHSSTSHHRSRERASPYPSSNQGSHTGDGDDEDDEDETSPAVYSPTPTTSRAFDSNEHSASLPLAPPDFPSFNTTKSSRTSVSPNFTPTSSSSASQSDCTILSDSIITPNTSPTLSQSGKTPTLSQVDTVTPLHEPVKPMIASASSPAVRLFQKSSGPWDWDGAVHTASSDATYRKPPRFRSKSRGSGSNPMSPIPASVSLDTYPSNYPRSYSPSSVGSPSTSTVPSSASVESHEDLSPSFTFPSLNASVNPSTSSPASPRPSRGNNSVPFNGNGNANCSTSTPRRAPTPRRPPTPLSGNSTPPPSLSTQTQLASLRGALEAARLREEKLKSDTERFCKELEVMRWESSTWRRREAELQAQIHHLVHQMQSYGALFSSMSAQPGPNSPLHIPPGPSMNGNGSINPSPNGYQFSPPTSNPHSPPPHLQIPPASMILNGMLPSPSMLPPMPMHASPHSPFFPYPGYPHPQQPGQSPHQQPNNLFSILFPLPTNVSGGAPGSGPPSATGSSSGSSHSPDLPGPDSSSTPPPTSLDRGRRRTRTAGPRIAERGTNAWEGEGGSGDGWIAGDDEILDADANGESDDDDGEGVSEALADAILKRPGSIRGLSKKGKAKEKDTPPAEFTFPSLSDFGNVNRVFTAPVEIPIENDYAVEVEGKTGELVVLQEAREAGENLPPAPTAHSEVVDIDAPQETS